MPTVRRYESGQIKQAATPLVEQTVKPVVDKSGSMIAQAGQNISTLGSQFTQQAIARQKELQDRKDKAAAKDAYVIFGDRVRDLKTEYQGRKQGEAIGSTIEAQRAVDDALSKIAGGLENDQQREFFKSIAVTKRGTFLDTQALYESGQLREWEIESSNALANEAIQSAVENSSHPYAVEVAKVQIGIAVDAIESGAKAARMKEAQVSKLHQAIINAKAVNDAAGAKTYYAKYKEEIDGTVRTGIEEKLKAVGVLQESQRMTDEIIASGVDYAGQLEAARAIKKLGGGKDLFWAKVSDAVVQRIKIRRREQEDIEKEAKRLRYNATTLKILDHIKNGGGLEGAMDIAAEEPEGLVRQQLEDLVIARYSIIQNRKDSVVDFEKLAEVKQRIDNGEIKDELSLIREYGGYLGKYFDSTLAYWRNGGAVGGLKDSWVRIIYENLTGDDPNENREQYEAVWDYVVSNWPEGKKPTDELIKKLVAKVTLDGRIKGGSWPWTYGKKMKYIKAVTEGKAATWLPDVDSEEEEPIKKELEAAGDLVSTFTIRLYMRTEMLKLPMTPELKEALTAEVQGLKDKNETPITNNLFIDDVIFNSIMEKREKGKTPGKKPPQGNKGKTPGKKPPQGNKGKTPRELLEQKQKNQKAFKDYLKRKQ